MDSKKEIINYKKKYEKELHHYIALMLMADLFKLPKDTRELLFGILDERSPEAWEWEKLVDRSRRIMAIFSEHPFYGFSVYPIYLQAALGKIKIMSN